MCLWIFRNISQKFFKNFYTISFDKNFGFALLVEANERVFK